MGAWCEDYGKSKLKTCGSLHRPGPRLSISRAAVSFLSNAVGILLRIHDALSNEAERSERSDARKGEDPLQPAAGPLHFATRQYSNRIA